LIHFSRTPGPLTEVTFDDTPEGFQRTIPKNASEGLALKVMKQLLGRALTSDQTPHYMTARRLLRTEDNAFFKFCVRLIGEYHAIDAELAQTLLLGMTRARYASVSALAHFLNRQ
jgi:hypothetical protein